MPRLAAEVGTGQGGTQDVSLRVRSVRHGQLWAEQKCQKRAYSYRHFAIVNSPVESEGDDDDAAKESFSDAISIEAIPDRKAIARMEFDWAYNELVALLDADERLALDYLLRDYDQSTVADWMSCTVMWFRRHILRSLQAKAELCGFVPHNGTYV